MSPPPPAIDSALTRDLYNDAQVRDEYATTRLWEYLLNKKYFYQQEWILSSQQPPSYALRSLRRVDLVIEHHNLNRREDRKVVVFVEGKKHGAVNDDIVTCEGQLFGAAAEMTTAERKQPVWLMSVIGTRFQLMIYDPASMFTVPFLPGCFALVESVSSYLDIDDRQHSNALHGAFRYIRNNHIPPQKFLNGSSPSVSTQPSGSSPPPPSFETLASGAKALPPLDPSHWIFIDNFKAEGLGFFASCLPDGTEIVTQPQMWTPTMFYNEPCSIYTDAQTRDVFYTFFFNSAQECTGGSSLPAAQDDSMDDEEPSGPAEGKDKSRARPLVQEVETVSEDVSMADVGGESSRLAKGKRKENIEGVIVTTISHLLKKDEYSFRDRRGKDWVIPRDQWKKRDLGSGKVMSYRSKDCIFYITKT